MISNSDVIGYMSTPTALGMRYDMHEFLLISVVPLLRLVVYGNPRVQRLALSLLSHLLPQMLPEILNAHMSEAVHLVSVDADLPADAEQVMISLQVLTALHSEYAIDKELSEEVTWPSKMQSVCLVIHT